MKVTRIYTGDDGRSHFEDLDIPLADDTTGQGHISCGIEGPRGQIFVALDDGVDLDRWR